MQMDKTNTKEMEKITVNSFYDVHQRKYTEEELQLYKDLTGMPLFDTYDQLMDSLTD